MSNFAQRCGIATPERDQAIACVAAQIQAHNIELVRVAWCDLHGNLRSKTLVARSAIQALHEGVGTVSTLLLKDTSDRTAFKVFEAGGMGDLPGFEGATDLLMLPDPTRFQRLPWAGIAQQRIPPPATRSPYAGDVPQAQQLPRSLAQALAALQADSAPVAAFGKNFVNYLVHIKQAELSRQEAAEDRTDFDRREYFSRL